MERLGPSLRMLRCNNPSPLTGPGTNTFVLGEGRVAVVDPGPWDTGHIDALLAALGDEVVDAILVTHAHLDHSPGARLLKEKTSAPIYAFGAWDAGRGDLMAELALSHDLGGGEGTDTAFAPDHEMPHGATLTGPTWSAEAIWTPGHFGNHLSFAIPEGILCGDLVMGWSTTLISPPDGDLSAFRRSCQGLQARPETRYFPAHGDAIEDGPARLAELLSHRDGREAQILAALGSGAQTPPEITEAVYTDTPTHLWPAATRNVLAHLIDLVERDVVSALAPVGPKATFVLKT